ncbi:exosortase A [Magnetospira thiophila]
MADAGGTVNSGARQSAYGVALLGVLALTALFFETARATVHVWATSSSFNHGFAILPVVAYLIWERRSELARTLPVVTPWALILVVGSAAVWLLGQVTGTLLVQQVGFLGLVESFVLLLLGPQVVWRMAFPLFFAWFAIPFGEFMVPPMQDITAKILVWGLEITGIPVYADGVLISIPSGDFEVAEACSGLRFFTASAALGVLGANMLFRSPLRRLGFILLALTFPIVANGIRAYGIVMLAHLTDREFALGVDHLIYGWVFFSLITVILIAIGWQFREEMPLISVERGSALFGPRPSSTTLVLVLGLLALALAAVAPAFASYAMARTAKAAPLFEPPRLPSPWRLVEAEPPGWHLAFSNPDGEARWQFSDGEHMVDVYIAYYARQRENAEAVSHDNRMLDKTWRRAGVGRAQVQVGDRSMAFQQMTLRSVHGHRVAWKTFWVDQSFTDKPWWAKLLQARATLLGGTPAAAVVVVSAPYWETPGAATKTLERFLVDSAGLEPALRSAAGLP